MQHMLLLSQFRLFICPFVCQTHVFVIVVYDHINAGLQFFHILRVFYGVVLCVRDRNCLV